MPHEVAVVGAAVNVSVPPLVDGVIRVPVARFSTEIKAPDGTEKYVQGVSVTKVKAKILYAAVEV
jgi:hypothetical protein